MKINIAPSVIITEDFEINFGAITIEGASEAFCEQFGKALENTELDAQVEALCKRFVAELLPKRGIEITEAENKD